MTSKERVRMALNFEEPDRVPISALFVPEVQALLAAHLSMAPDTGLDNSPVLGGEFMCKIGTALGNDMVKIQAGMENMFYVPGDEIYVTEWGVALKKVSFGTGEYTDVIDWPLAGDDAKLSNYQIPDPQKLEVYEEPARIIAAYGKDYWVTGSVQISIFEAAAHLRGLENVMSDMLQNKDYAHALFDKVMEYPLQAGRKFAEMGADMIWTGDDIAMQTGMMISPNLWREFFKHRYAKLFEAYKKTNPQIKIAYHSDGNCEAILDDMHEIGLDVINPIQPKCMNPLYIKKRYGKKLAMFGGVDIQHTMPFGTVDEVVEEVRLLCTECGKGGGYIISPSHYLQIDTSVEKILAYYESAKKYGIYN